MGVVRNRVTRQLYNRIFKVLKRILKSLQGRSRYYVKKPKELKDRVKNWKIERDETTLSYDVKPPEPLLTNNNGKITRPTLIPLDNKKESSGHIQLFKKNLEY